MIRLFASLFAGVLLALPAAAFEFASIDGGTLDTEDWSGRPVLVVNTASQCAYTRQYEGLQALYDQYRDRGLVVLAVPSDDFRQELDSAEAVKDFCEINYGLDLPMTDITSVTGPGAHPFYQWVRAEAGFTPGWNFNKVLLAPDGTVAGTYGSGTEPMGGTLTGRIEALLSE